MANDLFVAIAATSEFAEDTQEGLTLTLRELRAERLKRLQEVGEPPEEQFDLVLLAVPRGRGRTVAQNIVSGGFAHGDVFVEP